MGAFGVGHGCCGGRERFVVVVVVGRCEQRKYQGGGRIFLPLSLISVFYQRS